MKEEQRIEVKKCPPGFASGYGISLNSLWESLKSKGGWLGSLQRDGRVVSGKVRR